MDDFKKKYPESAKLSDVQDKSQAIGEFLELSDYHLTELVEEEECYGNCCQDHPHYRAIDKTIGQVLADYFEIDMDRVEAERRAMLSTMGG